MTVTGVIGGCLIILGFVPGGFIWRSVGSRVAKEPSSPFIHRVGGSHRPLAKRGGNKKVLVAWLSNVLDGPELLTII
jgi:hypothetical protein